MKIKFLFLALALAAQVAFPAPVAAQAPTEVQLTAELLEQTYCTVNTEISLQLKIRLRYTNLSPHPVILYRGHDLFFQTKLRSEPDAAGRTYQVL